MDIPLPTVPYSKQALIAFVKGRRILYDFTRKDHAMKNLVQKEWRSVAALFEEDWADGDHCQAEFRRLRENRMKRKQRQRANCRSGAAGGNTPINFASDDMAYLDEVGLDMGQQRVSNLRVGSPRSFVVRPVQENPPVLENCCEALAADNERREEEMQLRPPPNIPAARPSATSSPHTAVAATPTSGRLRSSSRTRRAPNRFTPPGASLSRRRLNTSQQSQSQSEADETGSDLSFAGSNLSFAGSNVTVRRRRRPLQPFPGEFGGLDIIPEASIHDESTLAGGAGSGGGGAGSQEAEDGAQMPVSATSRAPSQEHRAVVTAAQVHQAPGATTRPPRPRAGTATVVPRPNRRRPVVQSPGIQQAEDIPDQNQRPTRQQARDARDAQRRAAQLERERQRDGLRENIRLQLEARRVQREQAPAQQANNGESAEYALLREFLTEREMDGAGHFCSFLACQLRKMHPGVSGLVMASLLEHINEAQSMNPEEYRRRFNEQ